MFLDFDSHSIDDELFHNRAKDFDWLVEGVGRYLQAEDGTRGRAFSITGEKGVGKTIFVNAALKKIRHEHSGNTLFLTVDCRRQHRRRDVLAAIAQAALEELNELQRAKAPVSKELLDAAHVLVTVTRFDTMELKQVHEHLLQYKSAVSLAGDLSFLANLKMNFGISLERTEKDVGTLSGSITFDDVRLCKALCDFFADLRGLDFNVILWIDNLDELRHRYRDDGELLKVRQDAEAMLAFQDAPVALILCMRTYYSGIARAVANKRVLGRLDLPTMRQILAVRLGAERDEVRKRLGESRAKALIDELGRKASTPLSFLAWVKFFAEAELLDIANLDEGIEQFLRVNFVQLPAATIHKAIEAFDDPDHPTGRDRLLAACGGNEAALAQLQDNQIILPHDFWNPVEFTLDPELHLVHSTRRAA